MPSAYMEICKSLEMAMKNIEEYILADNDDITKVKEARDYLSNAMNGLKT